MNNLEQEYKQLYFDKLSLLAIKQCLKVHNEFVLSHYYETSHGQTTIVDRRNKLFEACLDKVFTLHKIYDEEINK
jgi:hypothetical protein